MKMIVEDTWFPAGTKIRISSGVDALIFLRCSFEGGEIFVEHDVEQTIFSRCVFHGTSFRGQPLSARIASECRLLPGRTEAAARDPVPTPPAKFRR